MKVIIDITDEERELMLGPRCNWFDYLDGIDSIYIKTMDALKAQQGPLSADMQRESIAFGYRDS